MSATAQEIMNLILEIKSLLYKIPVQQTDSAKDPEQNKFHSITVE